MQFNIIFKTIFGCIDKKFRFMHTNKFCKYRKKLLASPRVHLVLYIESLWRFRQTFRTSLSSVEIPLERGSSKSTEPINLKIGLEIGHCVIHVWKEWFLETRVASCKFMQFTIICKCSSCQQTFISEEIDRYEYKITLHTCTKLWLAICVLGFDWSTSPILLKIYVHVRYTMMHVWNIFFFKITIGNCKFMQLTIFFSNKCVCMVLTDLY